MPFLCEPDGRGQRRCRRQQLPFSLSLRRDQPPDIGILGIDEEDGEQARRFGAARVLADGMLCAGRLRPVLARMEHLSLAVIHPASFTCFGSTPTGPSQ